MRFNVGNLNINIICNYDKDLPSLFYQFLQEDNGASCYDINIKNGVSVVEEGIPLYEDERLLVFPGEKGSLEKRIYKHPLSGERIACTQIYRSYSETIFYKSLKDDPDSEFLYIMALALEKVAWLNNSFVLHSSSILVDGKIILFTAPSGTGKSTQADLWKSYRGATIVNGDRNLLFYRDGQFYSQGWVLSGSSEHRENINAPIQAIVYLSQRPENQVEQLTGISAFNRLLRETIANSWDSNFINSEIDFLLKMVEQVPVFAFACTKTEDAVSCLETYLKTSKEL